MDYDDRATGGQSAAPLDAYVLPTVEGIPAPLRISSDDPTWQAVRQAAREAGVPPKTLQVLALPVMRWKAETERADYDAEMARLGPNGPAVVAAVDAWLRGMVRDGAITEAERRAIVEISDADGVRFLAKLRELIAAKQGGDR